MEHDAHRFNASNDEMMCDNSTCVCANPKSCYDNSFYMCDNS